ncbi:prephenate dehydrogenase/arogenate dehydrogenase family protein [Thermosulfuriphilus ammonigenes]|uniref:Prephenate dehydrogenase/arogenate dehydrogenase family protein n=1 Tax=Thermosulfuriphilus ammonigenes TaxID=1936021 RepID=A0A6G7PWS4_9BACT|nr:prephenate dehydrogenase/arogenate dehydrogenase family protein [Thermosulfuriphilus ammonigenes]MBA2849765.1 prephenate dehydrogenase [Thermosulfuriphilus ammonigenes]QIJ72145.1 prephenate dehydrogenase/arogenate dehydrogenase family protein [Thermosulfuriphilus ammonigenes]
MRPERIGIVGGRGRMGRWFANLFKRAGYQVEISDLGTPLSNQDLARQCPVVFLAVPMERFEEVVIQVGPLMPPEAGLIDLCSLKARQVAVMLRETTCQVVGAHPLFGPGENSIVGQRVALCPARGNGWFNWFKDFLDTQGAETVVISPEEHDQLMAVIQVLNHFILLALGEVINRQGLDPQRLVNLATPSFIRQLNILSRLADQDPHLYAAIQFDNPAGDQIREAFARAVSKLKEIAQERREEEFVQLFTEVQTLGQKIRKAK